MTSHDLCFVDTETVGLLPDSPIWEFSATRVSPGSKTSVTMLVDHNPSGYIETLDEPFLTDYRSRYWPANATAKPQAAITMASIMSGAQIVGCNPDFDIRRIEMLVTDEGIEPDWHYHPIDIASVAIGYLMAKGQYPDNWKSDVLADSIGITSADFPRHTAEGDVLWTKAQWDRMRNA